VKTGAALRGSAYICTQVLYADVWQQNPDSAGDDRYSKTSPHPPAAKKMMK